MALVLKDRVKEQTTTTGTGSVTLGGAVSGFEAFSAVGDGNTTYYAIAHQTADEWEVGLGTYTAAGTTLSRDTILESSNSDAAVDFSAGTKDVFVTYPADKSVYKDGSDNVGIGTSSPDAAAKLDVNGQVLVRSTGSAVDTTPGSQYGFYVQPDSSGTVNLMSYSSGGSTDIQFFTNSGGAAAVNAMTIDSSQNVGIGTSSPSVKLELNNGGAGSLVTFTDGVATNFNFSTSGTVGTFGTDAGSTSLALKTAGSERMRIDSSGRVGIGTSSPSQKVDITTATAAATSAIWTGSNLTLRDTTSFAENVGGAIIFEGKFNTAGSYSTYGFIRGAKATGVDGASAGDLILGARSGDISFVSSAGLTDGTGELVRILSGGDVGIGTTPSYRLHISNGSSTGTAMQLETTGSGHNFDMVDGTGTARFRNVNGEMRLYGDLNTGGNGNIVFVPQGTTERMRIDSSGYVGINTSSPATRLHVSDGTSSFRFRQNGTVAETLTIGPSGSDAAIYLGDAADTVRAGLYYDTSENDLQIRGYNNNTRIIIDSSGNVGIGTTSPDGKLNVQRTAASAGWIVNGHTVGVGNDSGLYMDASNNIELSVRNGSGTLSGAVRSSGVTFFNGGNVGIGTTSPSGILDISAATGSGTFNIIATDNTTNAGNKIAFFAANRSDTDEEMAYIKPLLVTNSGGSGNVQSGQLTFGTFGSERMRIDEDGNVGIGTTSPATELDVNGTLSVDSIRNSGTASTASTPTYTWGGQQALTGMYLPAANTIAFSTNATERLRINSSGNVGIGTSSPGAELDIESTSPDIHLNDSDGVLGGAITSRLVFQASGTTHGTVGFGTSSGNMGLSNNQGPLFLQADTNNAHSNSYITFTVDNSAKMRITSAGNVGIGTTAPAKQLEITKSARATITSLTDAASIASNFDTAQNFAVTLGGNRTLANPSNIDPGQTGSIFVVQDGTGGRTLSFGSYWKFAGGTAPTMSTGAAAVDRIDYVVQTSTAIHAVASLNLS